ncbi:hypothetical protein AEAC466_21595 [Asticcacaulis sp. AC466]|uniref:DUF1796 family putative cysteine peptidase n=1 Tax=Asticcacaulis sp. AC466 TaxID=1282362 RepID=UPI0003C3B8AE|nr:DUF1796 family putative cysteine peptidase [Asticcacaulis sp. AC466]ESQ80725.1 hypothetical protein AEAC466_21595 [Asticcacaulis sp. AC466]
MAEYLSVGLNCQPIMAAIEAKLLPDRAAGRLTSVFDLCWTTREALCHFIETGFDDFFDDIDLIENPKGQFNTPTGELLYSFVSDKPYGDLIVNKRYGMIFNHESPGHPFLAVSEGWESPNRFSEKNFFHFRERYSRRVDVFLSTIQRSLRDNVEITFLMKAGPDDAPHLGQVISQTFPELRFKLSTTEFLDIDLLIYDDIRSYFGY